MLNKIICLAGLGWWLVQLTSCSMNFDESGVLPPAFGDNGEIVLVMDSSKWVGPLGDEIRKTFRAPVPGLLQDEPLFNLVHVDPHRLTGVLKSAKSMIFVTSLEGNTRGDRVMRNYFTEASLQKIRSDSNLFMYTKQNEWAKGQEVLHIFQKDTKALIRRIVANRVKLQNHFIEIDKNRLYQAVYEAKEETGIANKLLKDHQFFLRVPYGYEISIDDGRIVWLRQVGPIDKNLFITYVDYRSEDAFQRAQIRALRDEKWQPYLLGSDSLSYMVIQPLADLDTVEVTFNNKYAVRSRGSWKLNNNSMGGPFISYTFVDQALGRLYYIEGFVYAAGKNKRDLLREFDAILSTFRTASELSEQD